MSRQDSDLLTLSLSKSEFYNHLQELGIPVRTVSYPKGTTFEGQGERSNDLFMIYRGIVKQTHLFKSEDVYTLAIRQPGDFLGLSNLLCKSNVTFLETLSKTELLQIPAVEIPNLLSLSEEVSKRIIAGMLNENHENKLRMIAAKYGNVEQELCLYLYILSIKFGVTCERGRYISMKLSCRDIAEHLGHSRWPINKSILRLEQKGIIDRDDHTIIITEPEQLYKVASVLID